MMISLFVVLLCLFTGAAAAGQVVPFIVYNDYAPIILDSDRRQGLAYAVADLLSARAQGRYRFEVIVMPRRRLDAMLARQETLVVPFVDPRFFGDPDRQRFRWSPAMFSDQQLIVCTTAAPLTYAGPASLWGKRLGGIFGQRYLPLEADVARGAIAREDVGRDEQNLLKLLMGRLDAVSISSLSFAWQQRTNPRVSPLLAAGTLYPIERRMLVMGDAGLRAFLDQAVAAKDDADWTAAFAASALPIDPRSGGGRGGEGDAQKKPGRIMRP